MVVGCLNAYLLHALIRNDKINRMGKLYVIIGRFSAALDLNIQLERHLRAIFVGELTGSSLNAIGTR